MRSGAKLAIGFAAIFFIFLTGAKARAQAQATASLSGTVQTSQGVPIPSATVRAENLTMHRAWMSWTDASGKYSFPALPPGQYQVEATMLGFSSASGQVNLTASGGTLGLSLRVLTLAELAASSETGRRTAAASASGRAAPEKPSAGRPGAGAREAESRGQRGAPRAEARGRGGAPGQAFPPGGMSGAGSGMGGLGGGFQQVNVTGGEGNGLEEGQSSTEQVPGQAATPQATVAPSTQPLGAAASSDAFLMSGSVGRGVNTLPGAGTGVGGGFQPGGPGMMGDRGGFGGGGGRFGGGGGGRGGMRGGGPGRFRGRGPRGGSAAGSVAGLYARQRFMRRSANRVRFNISDTYQNSIWNARPYALNGTSKPQVSSYNERLNIGLGGPLYLPHIYDGRQNTFFFFNYGYGRQVSSFDRYATVPTVTERSGNFCDRNAQLYDPTSNLSGPRTSLGCQIPSYMINSAAQGMLKYIPEPNLPGFVQNFQFQGTEPQNSNFVNIHIRRSISSRFSLNGGYNLRTSSGNTFTDFPLVGGNNSSRSQNVDLSLFQSYSPRFVHITSLNFNRSRAQSLSDNSYVDNVIAALGIAGVNTSPINYGIPQIGFTNFTGLSDPIPSLSRNQTWRFDDSFTYSLTKHTFQGGAEVRRIDWNTISDPNPRGTFTFTGLMTSQLDSSGQPVPGTGLDFADFLLGLPRATSIRYGSSASYFRSWGFDAYFQDDWHATTRFTLDYGLRYDYVTPPIELYNTIANLDVSPAFSQAVLVVPGDIGPFSGLLPRSLVRSDPNTWAPRLGFAWQPFRNDPLIVRGGYSIFYNESIYQQLAFNMANQPPFASVQSLLTSPTTVLTLQDGFPSGSLVTNPNTFAVDPNYRVGYAQIWDLSLERSFRGGWMLDVYYTGTKGTHLDLQIAPHSLPPGSPLPSGQTAGTSGFIFDTYGASSIYHAAHVIVRKRPTHGLMVMGDYSFGKSIDDASTIGGGGGVVVQNNNDIQAERGLSSFDVRNQFRAFTFYQLPFGPRQRWARGGWAERMFGNFRLNGIITANSGHPFTAQILGAATNNTATGANFSLRANQIASGCAGPGTTGQFFNTAAFVVPPLGTYGDAARNTICGPGTFSVNLGLDRSFVFGQDRTRRLDIRWETRNLTNHPNYSGLSTVVNSTNYGRVTSVGGMRTMDITMRLSF